MVWHLPAPAQARHSARELFFVAFSSLIPVLKVQPESTIFHKALTSSSFYFCHLEEPQPLAWASDTDRCRLATIHPLCRPRYPRVFLGPCSSLAVTKGCSPPEDSDPPGQ